MIRFKRFAILFSSIVLLAACKHKKEVSLSGDEPVEVGDFINFFQSAELPLQFSDSVLQKKEKDSLLISYKVFTQFVPDSILSKAFGKGTKYKIYPIGKVSGGSETYLFSKIITGEKKGVFVLAFDKKQNYIAGMPVLRPDQFSTTAQSVSIDKRFTITKTILRKNPDASISEGKDVYVLNQDVKNFLLIMTDALDDKITELTNPIDTLPKKNKYSADYGSTKMNIVSVRDGRKPDRISFFIHFEKNNGECTGELKGEALLKSSAVAEYREGGDPCVLKFNFSNSSVTLSEESCGSRRGLKCSFDGSYARKKEIKPKAASVKKTTKK